MEYKIMFNFSGRLLVGDPFTNKSIISYGIILYALDTEKILLVQRKHSVEFVIFMTGNYRPTHLPFLLSMMTKDEKEHIINSIQDSDYFYSLYEKELFFKKLNLYYVYTRIIECKETILGLINYFRNKDNQLGWQWPKGRPNCKEQPFCCARREFCEEVETELPELLAVEPNLLETSFVALNGRTIESKYFFCVTANEFELKEAINNDEVSCRKWVHISELQNYMTLESDKKILALL